MKKIKIRKENGGRKNSKARFDKMEINKLKKNKKDRVENVEKLKKKIESKQSKKFITSLWRTF